MDFSPVSLALTDAILFTGEVFVERHALLIEGERILDIVPNDKAPANVKTISCAGQILAPAFIDAQVNGGGGVQLNASHAARDFHAVAAAHRKRGTTRLLPAIVTDAPQVAREALKNFHEAQKSDPSLIGLHLEGPHIALEKKGAHDAAFIRPPTEKDLAFYEAAAKEGAAKILLTVAPEQVTPDQIRRLAVAGVIVSLGHTAASGAQVREALAAGARSFTHLFNAMAPLLSREPGPMGVALDDPESWCMMIAHGEHVAPELIRLALRAKPEGRLFMVSDATPAAGTERPQEAGDLARTPDGTIAGMALTLGEIVTHAVRELKFAPERALRMASTLPAAFLELDKELGKLLPRFKADIVALDHFFRVAAVWREGQAV